MFICILNQKSTSASLQSSSINADFDLLNVQRLPYIKPNMVMGTVSDMVFDAKLNNYSLVLESLHGVAVFKNTE